MLDQTARLRRLIWVFLICTCDNPANTKRYKNVIGTSITFYGRSLCVLVTLCVSRKGTLKAHFSAYMRRVAFIIASSKHTLSLFLTSKDYLSDYECHKTHTLRPLPVWTSKVSLWLLLIPYLKSLYSNKWSLGCYAIKKCVFNKTTMISLISVARTGLERWGTCERVEVSSTWEGICAQFSAHTQNGCEWCLSTSTLYLHEGRFSTCFFWFGLSTDLSPLILPPQHALPANREYYPHLYHLHHSPEKGQGLVVQN